MKTDVHRVVLMVRDLNNRSHLEIGENMPRVEFSTVMSVETREVDWSDDHPLNKRDTCAGEFARLFDPEQDDGGKQQCVEPDKIRKRVGDAVYRGICNGSLWIEYCEPELVARYNETLDKIIAAARSTP